jgi:hypothetical protein
VAPIIERIGSGCTSNLMRVLIRLTAPEIEMSGCSATNCLTGSGISQISISYKSILLARRL